MDASAWAIVAVVGAALVGIVLLARRRAWNSDGSDDRRRDALFGPGSGGLFPAWRKAADDPRYAAIAPPSVDGWLQGQGALGLASSAEMKAAAVRSVWLDDDLDWPVVTRRLLLRHPDGAPRGGLARAAREALKAAEKAMATRGSVRARAEWRDVPGPLSESIVDVHVRCPGADAQTAERVAQAFATSFIARLAKDGHATTLVE